MILRDLSYPVLVGATLAVAVVVPVASEMLGAGNLAPHALAGLAAFAFALCLANGRDGRSAAASLRAAAAYAATCALLAALPMAAVSGLLSLGRWLLP